MLKWYPKNSARVHGVVYLGAGNRIGDAMSGASVPAMLVRGSRDPFTPPEVQYAMLLVGSSWAFFASVIFNAIRDLVLD